MSSQPQPLILVVEDDVEICKLISQHLELAEMQTQICYRGSQALSFLQRNFANLMLLDVTLPDQSGFALMDELKKHDITIPTIFLTGNTLENAKVKALDMGGDDYITKPFSYPELVARIRAVLRRAEVKDDNKITKNAQVSDEPFTFCEVKVDPARLEATFPDGAVTKIGRKELGILSYLNANPGVVVTRQALIHSVWGVHADIRSRSLDQYIVKIRDLFQKTHGLDISAFRTVHGVGYIFDPKGVSKEGL